MADVVKRESTGLDGLANEINKEHKACEEAASKAVDHAIKAGGLLAQAKGECKHGEWLPWLNESFAGSVRTAQMYMKLYERRDEIGEIRNGVSHLPMREALAAIAKPREVVEAPLPRQFPGTALYAEFFGESTEGIEEQLRKYQGMESGERQYFEREAALRVSCDAMTDYSRHVSEARERLIAHIDIISAFNENPAIDDVRGRICDNNYNASRLTPEEDAQIESLYPELHEKIRTDEQFVLKAERTLDLIEASTRPADLLLSREYFHLEKTLEPWQMRMTFAELEAEEILGPRNDPFAQHTALTQAIRLMDEDLLTLPDDWAAFSYAVNIGSGAGWSEDTMREMLPFLKEATKANGDED